MDGAIIFQNGGKAVTISKKHEWWSDQRREIFWCEITDREDVGADLKCPQTNKKGGLYWSYSLIKQVLPGDIVFHYSTRQAAFVGASIADAPLQTRDIVWSPHSLTGHTIGVAAPRPGWWLPLRNFTRLPAPLPLAKFRQTSDESWIQQWVNSKSAQGYPALQLPFQLYPGGIRGAQGYLTKMPLDFVNHWPEFAALVERLSTNAELLSRDVDFNNPEFATENHGLRFRPKDDSDYAAFIRGGTQYRSRSHETLVRRVGEFLKSKGAIVVTPHPIDLLMLKPCQVIFEMKIVDMRSPGLLIREAVGQLFEYRYFLGLEGTYACIVLECNPGAALTSYVENHLNMGIAWFTSTEMHLGPRTAERIPLPGNTMAATK